MAREITKCSGQSLSEPPILCEGVAKWQLMYFWAGIQPRPLLTCDYCKSAVMGAAHLMQVRIQCSALPTAQASLPLPAAPTPAARPGPSVPVAVAPAPASVAAQAGSDAPSVPVCGFIIKRDDGKVTAPCPKEQGHGGPHDLRFPGEEPPATVDVVVAAR